MTFFTIDSDATALSGLSAQDLDFLVAGTGLEGLGASFVKVEQTYHINALFQLALSALESGWGSSYFAQARNNIDGIKAYTSDPMKASSFPSKDACLMELGYLLNHYYLQPPKVNPEGHNEVDDRGMPWGEFWSGGTEIKNIFVHYSTSGQVEAMKVVQIMNEEAQKLYYRMKLTQTSPNTATSYSNQQYIPWEMKPGDSLWQIAQDILGDGGKWEILATLNNIKDPYSIPVGTKIIVPNPYFKDNTVTVTIAHPTLFQPVKVSVNIPANVRTYEVKTTDWDGLSGIAFRELKDAYRWKEIALLNPQIVAPKYTIFPGEILKLPLS